MDKKLHILIILLLSLVTSQPILAQNAFTMRGHLTHIHGIDRATIKAKCSGKRWAKTQKDGVCLSKATEGGDRIDNMYEQNIKLAHRHGLKVGSLLPSENGTGEAAENFMTMPARTAGPYPDD